MIPGGNLLAMANRVIAPQVVQYSPFVSRQANAAGILETVRAQAIEMKANIQPVPRTRYEVMGLDFQKNYATIYIQKNIIDIARDVAGDQFWFSGRLYEAESRTSWFPIDGWDAILCVEVPGCTPPFPSEGGTCCA